MRSPHGETMGILLARMGDGRVGRGLGCGRFRGRLAAVPRTDARRGFDRNDRTVGGGRSAGVVEGEGGRGIFGPGLLLHLLATSWAARCRSPERRNCRNRFRMICDFTFWECIFVIQTSKGFRFTKERGKIFTAIGAPALTT